MQEDTCQCFSAGGSGPEVVPQEAETDSPLRQMMMMMMMMVTASGGRVELCVLMQLRSTEMMEDRRRGRKNKKKRGQKHQDLLLFWLMNFGDQPERAGRRLSPKTATPRE